MAYSHKVVASVNNIPTSYDETAGSLMFTGASTSVLEIINTTNSVLAIAVVSAPQTPVSSITSNRSQFYIPAAPTSGSAGWVKDNFKITLNDRVYLRSDSGSAVTTGSVYFNTF